LIHFYKRPVLVWFLPKLWLKWGLASLMVEVKRRTR